MRRSATTLFLCLLAASGGAILAFRVQRPRPPVPDPPAIVSQVREVARLEALDIQAYKKVSFEPDPSPSRSGLEEVVNWARFTLHPPRGKAIVFAQIHLGLDLSRLDATHVRVDQDTIEIVLPPLQAQVELKPGETEVIGSNLDSEQTAQLLQVAHDAFAAEVLHDAKLKEKAEGSAKRAITALLASSGFKQVRFVETLAPNAL